jgi:hypothetical protein
VKTKAIASSDTITENFLLQDGFDQSDLDSTRYATEIFYAMRLYANYWK